MAVSVKEEIDEQELVQRITSGDRAAFKILVDRFSAGVINLCHRITGNRMDAEDVAQDVFVEIYKNIGRFRGESSLATWVNRIAYNRSLNFLRDSRHRAGISLDSRDDSTDMSLGETLAGKLSDQPDKNLEIRHNRSMLYKAIAELPEKYRRPFALHKLDGMPYAQIAETLNISLSAVESRIHRAKLKLQKELTKTLKG
ncbi:MAG: sigma-70 family RNA polymerase sigma factor [candidate division Zixibacteria bacterium]|nr:sigma-70 family RNA polymerase sigma factor [candidate division Zixibacteria bacterium]